ncbi:MAG: LysM peptidoglycan-binding domain-containing protein, partial [bacterium]|nr:LysM peptidoglycan-binding domain-containing protein [bacterium]
MEFNNYDNQGQSTTMSCNGMLYTIKKGDTLYKLSRRYNVPLSALMNANPNVNVYNMQVGQRVCIPVQNTNTNRTNNTAGRRQMSNNAGVASKKNDYYADYTCPECPSCPEQRECPDCPPQRECPAQRECPDCPPQRECPD